MSYTNVFWSGHLLPWFGWAFKSTPLFQNLPLWNFTFLLWTQFPTVSTGEMKVGGHSFLISPCAELLQGAEEAENIHFKWMLGLAFLPLQASSLEIRYWWKNKIFSSRFPPWMSGLLQIIVYRQDPLLTGSMVPFLLGWFWFRDKWWAPRHQRATARRLPGPAFLGHQQLQGSGGKPPAGHRRLALELWTGLLPNNCAIVVIIHKKS